MKTTQPYERAVRRVITAGLLLAITLVLVFFRIGLIPVPTPAANATVSHIPAIIGGILEGPLVGLIVGLGFGFGSFSVAAIPMFKDPLVAILPRLFIGVTAAWTYSALRRASRTTLQILLVVLVALLLVLSWQIYQTRSWLGIIVAVISVVAGGFLLWWMRREDVQIVSLALAAAVGSLTNTVLVLTMGTARGYVAAEAAWGIGLTHGIPEMIVSAIVTVGVVAALRQIGHRQRGSRL